MKVQGRCLLGRRRKQIWVCYGLWGKSVADPRTPQLLLAQRREKDHLGFPALCRSRAWEGWQRSQSHEELRGAGSGEHLEEPACSASPFSSCFAPSAGTRSTWSVKRLSVKSTGSFRRVRSARKISDLPSAWIKKIKGVKGVSPVVGEGWSTCNRTVGSGVGRERARRQVLHWQEKGG